MVRLETKKTLPNTNPMRKVFQLHKVNKKIVDFEYAVRGAQSIRADELKQELEAKKPLPFKSVIACNIGNPQQLGQAPITFYRQVTALIEYPPLMKSKLFPEDTVTRAKELLDAWKYLDNNGFFRQGHSYLSYEMSDIFQAMFNFPEDAKEFIDLTILPVISIS